MFALALWLQATAVLSGEVRERGTRDPVAYAAVLVDDGATRTQTDQAGHFEVALPAGRHRLAVLSGEHDRFETAVTLGASEHASARFFVERRRYGRYETLVRGKPAHEEPERQTLETEEIVKIPGTNGDALRSVENLPGVARAPFNSGILVVRGSPPEDSLVLVDGHQLPQLYHFGGLTSVINSDLIGRIDFL